MFGFIKDKFNKIYSNFTKKVTSIFSNSRDCKQLCDDLSTLLISSDAGIKATNKITGNLDRLINDKKIVDMDQIKIELEQQLINILNEARVANQQPQITLLVGVNGSGKTTFASKLANLMMKSGKKVLLVAGDTFRAAATQQLVEWGQRASIPVFVGKENQDPAAVVFDACKKFKNEKFDKMIVDTAGRLQTKVNLLQELKKIKKILNRQLPSYEIGTWLTIDSMLGQNSLQQTLKFHQDVSVDGIVLTKLDGTGKGGIVFAIADEFKIPITYITFGEKLGDVEVFDSAKYVNGLLYK
jgi:fused signal recognition particle receptor